MKIIPLTSEEEDSDSVSDNEIEDNNPSRSKTEERSRPAFDSSPKESTIVYGVFQNLVEKFQNTDLSSYIERAIEWSSEASTDEDTSSKSLILYIVLYCKLSAGRIATLVAKVG